MSKVTIKTNNAGLNELRKSDGVATFIHDEAQKRASACGAGYASDVKQMPTRVIASYYTETREAMRDNMENNRLLGVVK